MPVASARPAVPGALVAASCIELWQVSIIGGIVASPLRRKHYHDADAVNNALQEVKAAAKAKRDAARAAADPFALFDEEERAALGRGFGAHERESSKYDKYENTRNKNDYY